MSAVQIQICAARIPDLDARAKFLEMIGRAAALSYEARDLRAQAWIDYRTATGSAKRTAKTGPYA